MSATAFVGIGSNLGDREANLRAALELLAAEPEISLVAVSELRETDLPPRELLARLLATEERLGRVRRERWGPRTIDLDLLLYGDEILDEPGLTIPHPRLHERRFALEPLADLAPNLEIPGKGPVSALLSELE